MLRSLDCNARSPALRPDQRDPDVRTDIDRLIAISCKNQHPENLRENKHDDPQNAMGMIAGPPKNVIGFSRRPALGVEPPFPCLSDHWAATRYTRPVGQCETESFGR